MHGIVEEERKNRNESPATLGRYNGGRNCCCGQCGARRQFTEGCGSRNAVAGNGRSGNVLLEVGLAVDAADSEVDWNAEISVEEIYSFCIKPAEYSEESLGYPGSSQVRQWRSAWSLFGEGES